MIYLAFGLVKTFYLVTLLIRCGVALRGEHYAQSCKIVPLQLGIAALGHGTEYLDDITLQTRQHDLRLGVAEACIELYDLDALLGLHKSAVEHTLERTAFGNHGRSRRFHYMFQSVCFVLGRDERQRRICAHTSRIGTLVAVVCTFVILRQHHRPYLLSRDETHERKLGTREELLHDDPAAPELVVEKHVAQRLISLLLRLGYDHTLTGSQLTDFFNRCCANFTCRFVDDAAQAHIVAGVDDDG